MREPSRRREPLAHVSRVRGRTGTYSRGPYSRLHARGVVLWLCAQNMPRGTTRIREPLAHAGARAHLRHWPSPAPTRRQPLLLVSLGPARCAALAAIALLADAPLAAPICRPPRLWMPPALAPLATSPSRGPPRKCRRVRARTLQPDLAGARWTYHGPSHPSILPPPVPCTYQPHRSQRGL